MINNLWEKYEKKVIDIRRQIHRCPETAFQEERTAQILTGFLENLQPSPEIKRVAGTGVVATLKGRQAGIGRTIAVRADMDALNVQEHTGLPFASERLGYMHACGHDAHMAMALGAAMILDEMQDQWDGQVRFLFQPAEEQFGGAQPMIKAHVLEDPAIRAIIALHLFPDLALGQVGLIDGPIMASNDRFRIHVRGKSAHAANPEKAVDSILVAAHIVLTLQSIISREINAMDNAVLSFGMCKSGESYNVIPGEAELEGTVRTLNPALQEQIAARMREIVESMARVYGAEASLEYIRQYPITVNNPDFNRLVAASAAKIPGSEVVWLEKPSMMAEDFSFFLERIPGAMVFLGCGDPNGTNYPLHHGCFQFDERVLAYGTKVIVRVVLDYLSRNA